MPFKSHRSALFALLVASACGGGDEKANFADFDGAATANGGASPGGTGDARSGGASASGGAISTGGAVASGGNVGNGGAPAAGGALGNGGALASGGNVGNGGALASGGNVGSGGAPAAGGALGNGGAPAAGGALGNGGAPGAGGAVLDAGAGGAVGVGGAVGSGGTLGTGGAPGTGGIDAGADASTDASTDATASADGSVPVDAGIDAAPLPACQSSGTSVDVSGTIDYAGTVGGRVFVTVSWPNSSLLGGTTVDTTTGPPWSYTVRGLPRTQGTYDVVAYVDAAGTLVPNLAADPIGMTSVSLSGASVSGVDLTLSDPIGGAPQGPPIRFVAPLSGGAGVLFDPVSGAGGVEAADGYRLYWDTSPNPGPASNLGVVTVPAHQNFSRIPSLVGGTTYFLSMTSMARGVEGTASAPTSFVAGAPSSGATLSGTVSVPPSLVTSSGVLYVAAFSAQAGVRVTEIPNPGGAELFAITGVPDGTYRLVAILDREGDGHFGLSDPVTGFESVPLVVVTGSNQTGLSLSFPSTASVSSAVTEHFVHPNGDSYSVRLRIRANRKTPVSAVLCSGPSVVTPSDMTVGHDHDTAVVQTWDLQAAPSVGDAYVVIVTYSDGTQEALDLTVTGLLSGTPTLLGPIGMTPSLTPQFTWSLPGSLPADYAQRIDVSLGGGNRVWESGELPPGITSIVYDADGRGTALTVGPSYRWSIDITDLAGNRVSAEANFTVAP